MSVSSRPGGAANGTRYSDEESKTAVKVGTYHTIRRASPFCNRVCDVRRATVGRASSATVQQDR
jgi:hypothetical protein